MVDMARPKGPPKEKKPVVTTKAPAVEELAKGLIEKHHPSLKLAGIRYGFYGEGKKMKRFGKAAVVPEPMRVLLERPNIQFEVLVAPGLWNKYDELRRSQMLDEILCSMSFDGKVARIEKPDFKGYRANILRYGVEGHEELEPAFRNIQLILPVGDVPDNVDMATGEITDAPVASAALDKAMGELQAAVPQGGSVTITAGGKSATLRGKEQKPRLKGVDGLGNPLPDSTKRGARPTGPQVPVTS
jgi:hypothetical protein